MARSPKGNAGLIDLDEVIGLTLRIGGVATLVTLPVALGIGWLLARKRFVGSVIVDAVVHLPLVLPPVVTGWLLLIAFAPSGPIGSPLARWFGVSVLFRWTGAAIAAGVMAFPLMVRAIQLSVEAVDLRLEHVAATLGASPLRVFATITLPLSRPGVLAAMVLGFARAIGEFGATITFVSNVPGQTQTLPLAIYSALQRPGADAVVWRLAAVSVALSLGALIAADLLTRRHAPRPDVV